MESLDFVLFYILVSSTAAFILQSDIKESKYGNNSSSIIYGPGCDTGSCKNCNCCPGYGLKRSFFGEECKKCDCGKYFGCKFEGAFDTKTCFCPVGYTEKLRRCIGDCSKNPCENGGSCSVQNNDIVCLCKGPYMGDFCEKRCNTGSCQDCNCCPGYGLKSSFFGKECTKCDCGKDFGCEFSMFGAKTCHCPDGYTKNSEKCIASEKCSLITCQNNGQCVIKDGKATCNCTEEYTGEHCETDKCSQIKCQNGGTCIIQGGKAVCKCTEKYTGTFCQTDKCSQIKCQNGGTCIVQGGKAVCKCNEKYTGTFCQTDLISMDNSGDNIFVSFYLHRNRSLPRSSKFDFHFNMKETSNRTLTQILLRLNLDSAVQPNINKCSLIKCENGGKCSVENGKAVCTCSERYTGMNCEIDKCSLMVCLNGGKCEIRNQKTVCVCPEKFSGDFCERRPSSFTDGIKDYVIEP